MAKPEVKIEPDTGSQSSLHQGGWNRFFHQSLHKVKIFAVRNDGLNGIILDTGNNTADDHVRAMRETDEYVGLKMCTDK